MGELREEGLVIDSFQVEREWSAVQVLEKLEEVFNSQLQAVSTWPMYVHYFFMHCTPIIFLGNLTVYDASFFFVVLY